MSYGLQSFHITLRLFAKILYACFRCRNVHYKYVTHCFTHVTDVPCRRLKWHFTFITAVPCRRFRLHFTRVTAVSCCRFSSRVLQASKQPTESTRQHCNAIRTFRNSFGFSNVDRDNRSHIHLCVPFRTKGQAGVFSFQLRSLRFCTPRCP